MIRELDLAARKGTYGCSDLSTMLGLNPFRDLHSLWAQKIDGLILPTTKRQTYGKYFEEAILHAACEETGIAFRPCFNEPLLHPEFPKYHLGGNPDGLADDEAEGGIECKQVGWDQRHLWGPPEDAIPIVPPHYELQVRGYMAVTGRPKWRIAAWLGSDHLLLYVFDRDLEFERFILEHTEPIWRRYFEGRERPPIGGSGASAQWLKQKFPKSSAPRHTPGH